MEWSARRLDKAAVATFVFLLFLSPGLKRVWYAVFEAEIAGFRSYVAMLESPVDPWGNAWIPWVDGMQSKGPDGIDDGGQGDDLVISTLGPVTPPPQLELYERWPLDWVAWLVLVFGTFLLARNLRPLGARRREFALVGLLATPLITFSLLGLHEFGPYLQYMVAPPEFLVVPLPYAMGGAAIVGWSFAVAAVRRAGVDRGEA